MKVKNVLYTLQSGRMGGAEHSLFYLLKNLDRQQFNPSVSFLQAGGEMTERLEEIDVPYEILGLDLRIKDTRWHGITNPLAVLYDGVILTKARRDFQKYLSQKSRVIDLIHTNSWLVNNLVLLSSDQRIPVLWNVRDLSRPRLNNTLIRRAARIVCVSKAVKDLIYDEAFKIKFQVVHNGIDTVEFKPDPELRTEGRERMGLGETELVVGLFGRLTPLKGQAFFLKSAAEYLKKNDDVKIVVVGESLFDKTNYRPLLEKLVLELGITSRVVFMGRQKGMAALLNGIDVYVHPTTTKDAFPRTTLEAMATATPTLAARLGGIIEQIKDGVDGLLFTPNDQVSLLAGLEKLLNDPPLRRKLGQMGQKRVEKDFNVSEKTKEMERVYLEVINS